MAKALVIGGGGREHALCWKLRQSPDISSVFAIPGNGGMPDSAECASAETNEDILDFAKSYAIDLVVIGPEAYLVSGLGDMLRGHGIQVFGPGREGARIEGSKAFAKKIMSKYGIPTAMSQEVSGYEEALSVLDGFPEKVVIKADGLAAGKGVVVAESRSEALAALTDCLLDRKFGAAGERVLIEERMYGPEVSVLAVTDGKTVLPLPAAQDHKRVFDGDAGPNTGGMGCYSPVPIFSDADYERVLDRIVEPTVAALAAEGIDYRGVLYVGLMLTEEGPRVLEFNARFGDPETQAILPRLDGDLYELLLGAATGNLAGKEAIWSPQRCVSVVLASEGYPEAPVIGRAVSGLEDAAALEGVRLFHAGTERKDREIVTTGGRVLNVSALGDSFSAARRTVYEACGMINFEGMHYRKDIGARAEAAERADGVESV